MVTMAAALASFVSAWLVEDLAHLQTNVVVLAVVLSVMLGRVQRDDHTRNRLMSFVLIPTVVLLSGEIGQLMSRHTVPGDALFTLALAGSIWIRRFGPRFAKVGTQVTVPFIALLVTPTPPATGTANLLWTGVVALIAVAWVTAIQRLADRFGLVAAAQPTAPAALAAPKDAPPSKPGTNSGQARKARIALSTRMAIQMGVGLGVAFMIGHRLYPSHWTWLVLTTYIVASANRGRGDVIYKSALRVVGAVVGTVAATLLSNSFAPGDKWAVVAIFAVLAVALWLRSQNYAYWAGGITAALAFLYSYFGESGISLLHVRLEGILWGAAVALAAAWWILPVKTGDVLRRRVAQALAVLTDYLTALSDHRSAAQRDPSRLHRHAARFDDALTQLDQIAAPLKTHRFLTSKWRTGAHPADSIAALSCCRQPIHDLTGAVAEEPGLLADSDFAEQLAALRAEVITARRALAGRA